MSYVLPFDNSLTNELARSAIDNFASILINAFEQYQILWKENIDLQKKYEECKRAKDVYENVRIKKGLSQEMCTTCSRKLNNNTDAGRSYTVDKSIKKEPPDNVSNVSNVSVNSSTDRVSQDFLEGIVFNPYFDNEEEVPNKSFTPKKTIPSNSVSNMESPIISKSRIKSEKFTPARRKVSRNLEKTSAILSSTPDKSSNDKTFMKNVWCKVEKKSPLRAVENKAPLVDSLKKSDDVSCANATDSASTSKNCGKLTFGKLYNVGSSFRNDKLKQTRLLFVPPKRFTDLTFSDDSSIVVDDTVCDETKFEKDTKDEKASANAEKALPFDRNDKTLCEDVIQPSPVQTHRSTNLSKFLRLKRKSPDSTACSLDEKNDCLFKEKVFKRDDKEATDESDILANLDLSEFENNENFVPQKPNSPDNSAKKVEDEDAMYIDETYCELGNGARDCLNSQSSVFFEDQITQEKTMQSPKPTNCKPSLADLNKIPEKKVSYVCNGPVRKKSERAKLRGFSCRDCEKYYENMDLSESELEKRKDLCSRHRARQKIRESTPEGFWDPYFPDTCTASFGYD